MSIVNCNISEVVLEYAWLFGGLAVGVVGLTGFYLFKKWVAGGVCKSQARLDGKTVIITGANTGIGLETAVDLAKRNARVILACRSVEKGETAAVKVRKRSGNDNVVFRQLDLASLDSVRQFSANILKEEPRIDILINNAGVMAIPKRTLTKDGFEMQFGVNHLGHFLLTNLLLDRIKEAPLARIVNVSSMGHSLGNLDFENLNSERSYSQWVAYGTSKLANIVFTRGLVKHLEGTNVTANVLHPGAIDTELSRHITGILSLLMIFIRPFGIVKTPQQGAQTNIYCAVSEEMEGVTGKYLADCRIKKTNNSQATDDQVAERLWEVSTKLVGLYKTDWQ